MFTSLREQLRPPRVDGQCYLIEDKCILAVCCAITFIKFTLGEKLRKNF